MSSHLYIEGGESKEDQIRCRAAFRSLLEKAGFSGRMPRLSACGGREMAFGDFKTAHAHRRTGDFVALLIDSEDPLRTVDKTWEHLKARDNWDQPEATSNEQVLFMTTCMETWIVADRETLTQHYGHRLQANALPHPINLESRDRHAVQDALTRATRNCTNAYSKGKRSFEILEKIDPNVLSELPSFARMIKILKANL